MIKHSTVIKRIVKDSWRGVLAGTIYLATLVGLSSAAEVFLEWDWNNTYWSLFLGTMILWMLKGAYDWKKAEIQWEQEKMMRDLERKHL